MSQQNTQSQSMRPEEGGPSEAGSERYDLLSELDALRGLQGYASGEPTGRTLVKQDDLRVVVMALRSGARMPHHEASGPATIQVIRGTIHVYLPDERVALEVGQLMAIGPHVAHEVEAVTDAAFLLTLGRTRYEHVSQRHQQQEQ